MSTELKVIDAQQRSMWPSWNELYRHRELIWLFTKRNVVSRYQQMALAGAWSVVEPLAQLVMMSVVFGLLLRIQTNGYPYPIFVFAALIPWQLFARAAFSAAGSLQENGTLLAKVYFPRLALPIAAVARDLFDGILQFFILMGLGVYYGFLPSLGLLLFGPILLVLLAVFGMGVGLLVAAYMVQFRDVRPFLAISLQAGMYTSPVLFAATVVPDRFQFLYQLNPMYWAIETFRLLLLHQPLHVTAAFPISMVVAGAVVVAGIMVFTVSERSTIDVL